MTVDLTGYKLTFDDEFNGTSLDTTKWKTQWPWGTDTTQSGNYSNQQIVPQNVVVGNGVADFLVTKGTTPDGKPYGIGAISSTYTQTYGYWEAGVEMPTNADGVWPAFWLLKNGTGPDEIDISEWLGNGPTTDYMTYHSPTGSQAQGTYSGDLSSSYHTLGAMWTPTSITWYVDGVQRFTTSNNISSSPMTTTLNTAIGGWNNNVVDSKTVLPSEFKVDYIHIYSNASNAVAVTPQAGYTGPGGTTGTPPGTADTQPPTVPTGLTATEVSPTQVKLAWNASTDNVGVYGYDLYRDGTYLGFAATPGYSDTVVAGSTHSYQVLAYDAAHNASALSPAVTESVPTTNPVVQPFTLPVSGAWTDTIYGSKHANVLTGTSGNDYIDGRGGVDTMRGGAGDDTYVVDNVNDVAVENAGQGIDTIRSSASSYTLPANVENLTFLGGTAQTGVGNALNNIIIASASGNDTMNGGAGNDILYAGKGADTLTGGTGTDIFAFSAIGAGSRITDFHIGEDLLDLRLLLKSVGYTGSDPIADHTIGLASDGTGGTVVTTDPSHTGTMHNLVDLQGVAPATIRVGSDLLWHSS
jgi:serralysin